MTERKDPNRSLAFSVYSCCVFALEQWAAPPLCVLDQDQRLPLPGAELVSRHKTNQWSRSISEGRPLSKGSQDPLHWMIFFFTFAKRVGGKIEKHGILDKRYLLHHSAVVL